MIKIFPKFFPFFLNPLSMAESCRLHIGGSSKSQSSTYSDSSQTITNENKQVGASEGATAIGAGANVKSNQGLEISGSSGVTLQTVDDKIIEAAGNALTSAATVSTTAAKDALDFGDNALQRVNQFQDSANDLVRQTNELFGSVLTKTFDSQTEGGQSNTTQRYLLIAGLIAAGSFVLSKSKFLK